MKNFTFILSVLSILIVSISTNISLIKADDLSFSIDSPAAAPSEAPENQSTTQENEFLTTAAEEDEFFDLKKELPG